MLGGRNPRKKQMGAVWAEFQNAKTRVDEARAEFRNVECPTGQGRELPLRRRRCPVRSCCEDLEEVRQACPVQMACLTQVQRACLAREWGFPQRQEA